MSVTVLPLPDKIVCDRSGLPVGHTKAVVAARQELADFINELPESVYHLNGPDLELAVDRMLARYFAHVVRER